MSGAPGSEESFFRSRWVEAPAGVRELDPARLAPGFRAAGVHCGLKGGGKTDVGLLVCDAERVDSALVLTRNASAAAPIRVCRELVDRDHVRAAVINSGNANAETGAKGFADALAMCERAADALGLEADQVAVAETGVIGVPMPMSAVLPGIEQAARHLSGEGGAIFAEAIMTTDRWPKAVTVAVDGVTLSAQAKGAGMMQPNMATLLSFVQTDAVVADPGAALRGAVETSYNRITVDGQMSTNDTVLLQATGASGRRLPAGLLEAVLLQLAIEIIRDGEGAHRVGLIRVEGAADRGEAERVARAIANSPLVKTALYGRDPNWGRIAQAAGAALAGAEMNEIGAESIDAAELGGEGTEAEIGLRLSRGDARAHVYFSDLGHEYVTLNAEYTT
ncbi:MAG TPA: bifunctional glutamate N-acetyltransferase/amino-acid acetyltransferase ArgJ [Solirubrobacterales bacterium]|nr:bifunctional glutamate N-acetyltransferase/amino-acid acetyltransferase ArgJ [Solirubrobacterales bacterium]